MNHRPDENKWLDAIRDSMAGYETPLPDGMWDDVARRLPQRRRVMPAWLRYSAVAAMIALALGTALWLVPAGTDLGNALPENRLATTATERPAVAGTTETPSEAVMAETPALAVASPAHFASQVTESTTPAESAPAPETTGEEAAEAAHVAEEAAEQAPAPTPPLPAPAAESSASRRQRSATFAVNRRESRSAGSRFGIGVATSGSIMSSTDKVYDSDLGYLQSQVTPKPPMMPNGVWSGSWTGTDGSSSDPQYGIFGNQTPDGTEDAPDGSLGPGDSSFNSPVMPASRSGEDGAVASRSAYDLPEKTSYRTPVKFSVSASYRITPRLSVESGITYTYLDADLRFAGSSHYIGGSRTMHYLGIPAGVRYRFASLNRFDFYASAQFLAELCVSGRDKKLLRPQRPGADPTTVRSSFREHRPQFSANGAAGVQWNLSPSAGIYAEPGIGYYFNNGSGTPTVYKDYPLNFNINIGFRLTIP